MRRKLVYACIYIKYIPHEGKKLRKLDRVNYDNKLCVKLKNILRTSNNALRNVEIISTLGTSLPIK